LNKCLPSDATISDIVKPELLFKTILNITLSQVLKTSRENSYPPVPPVELLKLCTTCVQNVEERGGEERKEGEGWERGEIGESLGKLHSAL
jgi:hypothetical protein